MRHMNIGSRCLGTVMAVLVMSLGSVPEAPGWPLSPEEEARAKGEWDTLRDTVDRELRRYVKRIADIEAKGRSTPSANPEARAAKITEGRIAEVRTLLKGQVEGKASARAAEQAVNRAKTPADIDTAHGKYVDSVTRDWADGPERKTLRIAWTALQKNIGLIEASLAAMTEAAGAMSAAVRESGVVEKLTRSEEAVKEAGERLSARWERERAAREREREQREREASERARARP